MKRIDIWFFFTILVVVVLVLIFNMFRTLQTNSWQSTTGTVLSSEVKWIRRATYVPNIVYTYSVEGKSYKSSLVSYSYFHSYVSYASAQRSVENAPVGSTVTVFYNPKNPQESVLERNILAWNIGGLIIAFIMATAFLARLRKISRSKKT